jgi:hypothetical protein
VERGAAGEGGADEGWEGGEAEEYLQKEVVAEGAYGGQSWWGFRQRLTCHGNTGNE